ncbi:MAG: hypothetical protein A2452_09005 [Candidatus Firestonebacteria bacterium RIFOXYC2_FULL_39_67]|nr:MAG: hypothetical protein A2536_09495 [Candidatus Firestonebacteria bacterium RIFOXYD2_FULL_39_29]OGF53588.1 MAG: hypothetical protein A2452_09005 [Candidatus Firestonebacteria bacterium RIFOXYC2_FULL_39_67]
MPEKVIIHNSSYNLVESKGRLYIIPQPAKPNPYKLSNIFASTVTVVLCACLLLFPAVSIFLLLSLIFTNMFKKGLNK